MSTSIENVQAVASIFKPYPELWFVSGGWAIDLFLNSVTREHEDLEVGVLRRDQRALRALLLPKWDVEKVVETSKGMAWVPWYEGERLELPIHQVKASCDERQPREFEMFLNDIEGDEWWFRRLPAIRYHVSNLFLHTPAGIPYLRPEIQLLYKARLMRNKDAHDFRTVLPRLLDDQRTWLRVSLTQFLPEHIWLAQLERQGSSER